MYMKQLFLKILYSKHSKPNNIKETLFTFYESPDLELFVTFSIGFHHRTEENVLCGISGYK